MMAVLLKAYISLVLACWLTSEIEYLVFGRNGAEWTGDLE